VGDKWNALLANFAAGGLDTIGTAGEAMDTLAEKLKKLGYILQAGAVVTPGALDDVFIGMANAGRMATENIGEFFQFVEKNLGPWRLCTTRKICSRFC